MSSEVVLAIIAALSAIFGGVGLKVIERMFIRTDRQLDEAGAIRKELREDVAALKLEINALEREVDDWRIKYYALLQKCAALDRMEIELTAAHQEIAAMDKRLNSEIEKRKRAEAASLAREQKIAELQQRVSGLETTVNNE